MARSTAARSAAFSLASFWAPTRRATSAHASSDTVLPRAKPCWRSALLAVAYSPWNQSARSSFHAASRLCGSLFDACSYAATQAAIGPLAA